MKHNLARVRDSLANGYCGRPPQQDCPYPNACLTCPDFQTTVTFLAIHRQQAEATRALLDAAEDAGCHRQAANHRIGITCASRRADHIPRYRPGGKSLTVMALQAGIVLVKAENDAQAEVVDGQQRLTSLTILLSALREHVSSDFADSLDRCCTPSVPRSSIA